MANINQTVWKILQNEPAIQKDLTRGIVNIRALAKYILDKYSLTASLDAIISAIRRFEGFENFEEEKKAMLSIFQHSIIKTRNNVACLTVDLPFMDFIEKISKVKPLHRKEIRIVNSSTDIKLIVANSDRVLFKNLFKKNQLKKMNRQLSEISVRVSEVAVHTKGVLAKLANEISLANINIIELIICPPEFLVYVKEKDMVRAHSSIMKLTEAD